MLMEKKPVTGTFSERFAKSLYADVMMFDIRLRLIDLIFLWLVVLIGVTVRCMLFDIVSGDYVEYLSPWMDECAAAGGFAYLRITPGADTGSTFGYGCMYQYIFVIIYYLSGFISDMYLIKLVSVIFDIVCAITVFRLAHLVTDGDVTRSCIALAMAMLLPFSALNSGAWAQGDSIYCSFILLAVLHLLLGHDIHVFVYLAMAFVFKLQAVFIVPFFIIMYLRGKLKARYAFLFPVICFITMYPALAAGRSFLELSSIYLRHIGLHVALTKNYPGIYATIDSASLSAGDVNVLMSCGVVAAAGIMCIVIYYFCSRVYDISNVFALTLAIFTSQFFVYLLPAMHERYGYVPEMLVIVWAVTRFRRFIVSSVLWVISLMTYSEYLFGISPAGEWQVTLRRLSFVLLAAIAVIGYDLLCQMNGSSGMTGKTAH